MSDKPRQTAADYMVIALSPVLIMALVGSLTFFLLEILYVGQYSGRLQWTLFFFVFGIVLIARMSILPETANRAAVYGAVLGLVVFIATFKFVEYDNTPVAAFGWAINLCLMAVIWWSAHRLTWDCTHIDEKVDASGAGVLEAAGLDATAPPGEPEAEPEPVEDDQSEGKKSKKDKGKDPGGLFGWGARYRRYREAQLKKPHTPGVWVVYFSLAALPLFGLGQALIPPEETGRRQYVFWLMGVYVGSGLGLLLTTCFLGLRRYLRQRNVDMPKTIARSWLTLGGGLTLVLLVAGALLPRPAAEYSLIDWVPLGSRDQSASEYALKQDGSGQGEGQSSTDPSDKDKDKGSDGSGTKADDKEGGAGKAKTKTKASGKNAQSKDASGSGKGQESKGNAPNKGNAEKKKAEGNSKGGGSEDKSDEKKDGKSGKSASQPKREGGRSSSPSSNPVSKALEKLNGPWVTVLKWIVFVALALVVVVFLARGGLRWLANFTQWARDLLAWFRAFWEGLFGARAAEGSDEAAEPEPSRPEPRPFSTYANPFATGMADDMDPGEVVRYSFEALEAWAYEQDWGRREAETPAEFAGRLGREAPALETPARQLASLYARVAYARGRLTKNALDPVRQFWEQLQTVHERPLSA